MRAFTPRGMKATRKKHPRYMQMSVTSFHRMSPPNLGLRVSCFTTTLPGNSQDEEGRIVHAQRSPRLEDFIADIKGDEKWQFEKLVRAQ